MISELCTEAQVNDDVFDSWDRAHDDVMFMQSSKAHADMELLLNDALNPIVL